MQHTDNIRVLIVDDSFFMRKVIKDILQTDSGIEIVGEAADGQEALEQIALLRPTVVTLDIEMPRMDGLQTLRAIVSEPLHPSVVMVSGYTQEGASVTLQCLAMGATDFVLKPSGSLSLDMSKVQGRLLQKIKLAAEIDPAVPQVSRPRPSKPRQYDASEGVVVIGASTGGPAALETLLPELPAQFPLPVVVAQHLPKSFAKSFADRLRQHCALPVSLAEQNMELAPGIYIARGGSITTIATKHDQPVLRTEENIQELETPSVSRLMASAAAVYRDKTIGVILTGMGKDGLVGMERIKDMGGSTIVQDEATSAVYGMGQAVVHKGLADAILPLSKIMDKINEIVASDE